VFLRKTFRVFEQLDDVVNDIVNFAAANDAPGLEGKYPFNQPDVAVENVEWAEEAFRMFTIVGAVFLVVVQREPTSD
jgi:hypothetical protein